MSAYDQILSFADQIASPEQQEVSAVVKLLVAKLAAGLRERDEEVKRLGAQVAFKILPITEKERIVGVAFQEDPVGISEVIAGQYLAMLDELAKTGVAGQEGKAENYIEHVMHDKDGRPLVMIIARAPGKTPHALRLEAERESARLAVKLRDAEKERDAARWSREEVSEKSFSAEAAQHVAAAWRAQLVGERFRHWKGNLYEVKCVSADEVTGEVRVTYVSLDPGPKQGWEWSRTLDIFLSTINGRRRFEKC